MYQQSNRRPFDPPASIPLPVLRLMRDRDLTAERAVQVHRDRLRLQQKGL